MTDFIGGFNRHPSKKVMVEMKAGRCIVDGNCVSPDNRKGRLQIIESMDGLKHIQWVCRNTNEKELDIIVVDDAYLERVHECKTGRVYVLKFTSSNKKVLFWLQSADDSKDNEIILKFNKISGGIDTSTKITSSSQNDTYTNSTSVQQEQLTNLLLSFAQQIEKKKDVSLTVKNSNDFSIHLNKILSPERLKTLCEDKIALEELKKFTPETENKDNEVLQSSLSPHISHAMNSVTETLYSDHFSILFNLFELDYDSLSNYEKINSSNDPMLFLFKQLEDKYHKNQDNNSSVEKDNKN